MAASSMKLRALDGEVSAHLFSRTHGSALFVTRDNTQALAVTTLAAPGAEQMIETMETTGKRRFMLHYNFPPFSVGETGNFRGLRETPRDRTRQSCAQIARALDADKGGIPIHRARGLRDHVIERFVLAWLRSARPPFR